MHVQMHLHKPKHGSKKKTGEGFNLQAIDKAQGDLQQNALTCSFVQGERPQKHTWIIM